MRRTATLRARKSGFSLFELVITLAIVAIVFGLGAPALSGLAADNRLRAETDALFHAVHLARKQSITRRRVVLLCPSLDGATCAADDDWSRGWIVYENAPGSAEGARAPGEVLLGRHGIATAVRLESNRRRYAFRATHLRATNGTILVCDPAGRARTRALVISYTGRPRVAYEDREGRPWRCAH